MLFVLFGGTLEVGKAARDWFVDHDVPIIQKKHCIPEGFPLTTLYDRRNESSREEVEACDYVYENNGMLVGINKLEILDAVRGRCDRLLTGAANDISFVEKIKHGFGEYVTTICVYIEQPVLGQLTRMHPEIEEREAVLRTALGDKIKVLLNEHRTLFDDILLYSGEETAFDLNSVGRQLECITDKARTLQKQLNDVRYVEAPYRGGKPYLFVSYSHKDRSVVDTVLNYLQTHGCRVWYDDDMVTRAGLDWRDIVFEKLRASTQCILFSSRNAAESEEVDTELCSMLKKDKPFIAVRIDDGRFKESREEYIEKRQVLSLSDSRFYEGLLKSIDPSVRVTIE